MTTRPLTAVFLSAVVVTAAAPSARAATGPGDTPRAAWLERFTAARQGSEETDRIVRTFTVGNDGALDLSNVSGDVRVTVANGRDIRVEATKRVRHRDAAEARRTLAELRVDMAQVGNRVEVRTVDPRRSNRGNTRDVSMRVDYIVTVPATTTVRVRTISGNTDVNGVSGEVRAEAVSGDVRVAGTPNLAMAKTVSGDVTARDIGSSAGLTLSTISGTVRASGLNVRGLDCSSVSGNVELSGVQAERVQAKSVSGDLAFGATLARDGRYEFSTHSGNVRVMLASDTGFDLDASTFSGSVRSDLPITLRAPVDGRRGSTRSIRGVHGDGSAVLAVKTFSGSVVIVRR